MWLYSALSILYSSTLKTTLLFNPLLVWQGNPMALGLLHAFMSQREFLIAVNGSGFVLESTITHMFLLSDIIIIRIITIIIIRIITIYHHICMHLFKVITVVRFYE